MPDTPNYGFYRKPRFSANHLADYMAATTAGQRESIVRSAKFPRKPAVIPYSQAKRTIAEFLASNSGNLLDIDEPIRRLETRLRREPEGWTRDEIQRNLNALEAFKVAYRRCRMRRYTFAPGPVDVALPLKGVRLNVRCDVVLSESGGGDAYYTGGCVMFLGNSDVSRKSNEDRRKAVAALVHWSLQEHNPNQEPLERLCMSFDVFGAKLTKAATSTERLRANMDASCREAASQWDGVEPPSGYDGPDWR